MAEEYIGIWEKADDYERPNPLTEIEYALHQMIASVDPEYRYRIHVDNVRNVHWLEKQKKEKLPEPINYEI